MRLIWLKRRIPRRWRRRLKAEVKQARASIRARRAPALDEGQKRAIAAASASRLELWTNFVNAVDAREVAEIGVYRGTFAEGLLTNCSQIETYYMIDPWRRLRRWNKPSNKSAAAFSRIYDEAMSRTSAWADKRVVLRGKSRTMVPRIRDGTLDFVYVDGDHTLRGITIDLVVLYPKVRDGGWIGGDDFKPSIWQHSDKYEPTLVFPFAVHFAEAMGVQIYALPHDQFLIHKRPAEGFSFVDLTGRFGPLGLRHQFAERMSATPRAK
jgi:hypothetical protein